MILVAGLAIAGLAGIAAAFYFSMRPGVSRVRPGGARASRSPGSPGRSAGSAGTRSVDRGGPGTVIDFTGPQRILEDPEPQATGHRARHGDRPAAAAAAVDEPAPGRRAAARRGQEADTEDAAQGPRSRRRVGWRKGSDVDEELWPAEAFGGVSDEQFWDDLAADKPLATTARPAQPEPVNRRRRGPLPDLHPGADRAPGSRSGGRPSSAEGAGTHPQPRLGADDRTAIQPAVPSSPSSSPPPSSPRPASPRPASPRPASPRPASPRPASPVPSSTLPSSTLPSLPLPSLPLPSLPLASPTAPMTTQPYPAAQPSTATQPVRAAYQPEPRGRSRARASADDDPLTSPAYSLRPKGAVDGRSYSSSPRHDRPSYSPNGQSRPDPLRSDPLRPEPLRSDSLRPADPYAAYPYSQQPYGESYGPGSQPRPPSQAGPADDPRRSNGGRSPGQPGRPGAANGNSGARPAYPPVNGHRGPYDPRGYDRRLTELTARIVA